MTNISASPDTIRAVVEVLEFAALLDDRIASPDKARIAAWAEQVQRLNLNRDDLMDGLQTFYDRNDAPINIGGLIQHSTAAKRDRLSRETDAERETRQAANDSKTEVIPGLISTPIGPVSTETNRLQRARQGLDACYGRDAATLAVREYLTARIEATQLAKTAPPKGRQQIAIAAASAALTVQCPWEACSAAVNCPCLLDGKTRAVPHPSRIAAAAKEITHV